nr:glycoside hydrolase TIM-barrel-like domain-containing protein [Rhodoplanes serenus]
MTVAGAWAGGAIGGAIGQAAGTLLGAYVGALVEQDLYGPATDPVRTVEGARVTDLRVSGSAYGQPIATVWGRARVPANIVWLRGIKEIVITETEVVGTGGGGGGGKGGGSSGGGGGGGGGTQTVTRTRYEYTADILLAACEGPVTAVYRLWVSNQPVDPDHVGALRVWFGDADQPADPLVAAVEGAHRTPAHRGLVTVMLEDFKLTPHGNRFPNFELEVFRGSDAPDDARRLVEAVCLIPGSGEFVLDTDMVSKTGHSSNVERPTVNGNTGQKRADFVVAVENLRRELPNAGWVSLIYAWFGTSLDAGACSIRPASEYSLGQAGVWGPETTPHLWAVAGLGRDGWPLVSSYTLPNGTTALSYGGTVADGSVLRAIAHLRSQGLKVLFYPFLMMDIPPPDPAPFPWRGRITGAAADVAGFFTRPDGYLRFVRHCMTLAEQAGGVDAFAVGSEMVALNRIRDAGGAYPAVPYWRQVAAEAKARLGSSCIVTYAADWSEYRYHDRGSATVDFPLDALWADPNVDVVGIDAYFPLTDEPRSLTDPAAIGAGWASGELADFFYASEADRDLAGRGANRVRSPIDDRFWAIKDLRWWWENPHVPKVAGVPTGPPSPWVPREKPIWFTEYGFPSVNCAPNRPNVFVDPKSAESQFPWYSNRSVDRVVQRSAIKGTEQFWRDPANNPVSPLYGGPMVGRRFLWCWDARPFPFFPALTSVWSDGDNYRLGHWVQGKIGTMQLSAIVRDLCLRAGLAEAEIDVSGLTDEVTGYVVMERKSIREMIAVLQTAFLFDAVESGGTLRFVRRGQGTLVAIDAEDLGAAEGDGDRSKVRIERTQDVELPVAIDVVHLDEARDYQTSTVTARRQIGSSKSVTTYSLPIVLSVEEAQQIAQRALREIWQGRVALEAKLPTRAVRIDPTDVVEIAVDGALRRFRVTSVTFGRPGLVLLRGVATDGDLPQFVTVPTGSGGLEPNVPDAASPTRVELLDLPLMTETHAGTAQSFYMAACSLGGGVFRGVQLFRPTADGLDYTVAATATVPSVIGDTLTVLAPGPSHVWDEGSAVDVQLAYGSLESLPDSRILDGANGAMIDGEVIQFANATLIGPGQYRLSRLLRGRLGTEHHIVSHPMGSRFVMLDPGRQVRPAFSGANIGQTIGWRYAPVPQRPAGDQSGVIAFANTGEGLKPWSPVHLRGTRNVAGDLAISWVRRTRFGGWWRDLADVPLEEESERYEVDILNGAIVIRTLAATAPASTYTVAQQVADFGSAQPSVSVRVAQLSAAIGRGTPAAAIL